MLASLNGPIGRAHDGDFSGAIHPSVKGLDAFGRAHGRIRGTMTIPGDARKPPAHAMESISDVDPDARSGLTLRKVER
jgi:hypothetical protein